MRFQVPQFIDVEDRIFGPFTFRQFIYIAGGAGLCFIMLKLLPRVIAYIVIIPIAAISLALAFYRVNGKPFINIVEAAFKYVVGSRLYIWKRSDRAAKPASFVADKYAKMAMPKMDDSKLKDLFWTIDVKEHEKVEREKEKRIMDNE